MNKNKISVIIPAFNEEENIIKVLNIVKKSDIVDEVIVVDNACTDNTAKVSIEIGAKVVYCEKQGKGYAMEEGIKNCKNEILVFLDADVLYEDTIVEILAEPIISGRADFVKSTFNRTCRRNCNQYGY